MKNKLKSYSKAGLVACLCISLAILGIAQIVATGFTGDGVLYFAIPSLITLSLIAGAFWLKGYKGNDSDKEWVENNW